MSAAPCLTCRAVNRTKGWFYTTASEVVGYAAPGGREGREQRGQPCGWVLGALGGSPQGAADLALAGRSSLVFGEGGMVHQAGETVATPYDGKNCFPREESGRPYPT